VPAGRLDLVDLAPVEVNPIADAGAALVFAVGLVAILVMLVVVVLPLVLVVVLPPIISSSSSSLCGLPA
jgi:hypothetical protein